MGREKKCFVCGTTLTEGLFSIHQVVSLPVCNNCKGSDEEKEKTKELLDSLSDGLICGCI